MRDSIHTLCSNVTGNEGGPNYVLRIDMTNTNGIIFMAKMKVNHKINLLIKLVSSNVLFVV